MRPSSISEDKVRSGAAEAGPGKSGGRAAPGKQDEEGIKWSRGKWDAAWHKGSDAWRGSRARAESRRDGEEGGREDPLFLFTQQ